MNYTHVSVLLEESIDALNIGLRPDGVFLDGTVGGGGHSAMILQRLGGKGFLLGIDRDKTALIRAGKALDAYFGRYMLVHGNFSEFGDIADRLDLPAVSGAVLDLGVSSFQLDDGSRGFSYMINAALDMRMDGSQSLSAYEVVNNYDEKHLSSLIFSYGEERWAKRIAEFIVAERKIKPIETTFELVSVIKKAVPKSARADGPHPAKRTFQAIRIEVNNELDALENAVIDIIERLEAGGRLAVISFHSLEDRIIKNAFRKLENPCSCPRDLPQCVCGKSPIIKVVTRKPVLPSDVELRKNHRARSAKLRVAEKI